MAHPRERLRSGEQIILDTRPHWWYFARPMLFLFGSILMGILVLVLNASSDDSSSEPVETAPTDEVLDLGFTSGLDLSRVGSASSILQIATGLTILLSLVILAITFVTWYFTHFFITTDRVVHRSGILNRQGVEIPIDRINTVFFEQNFVERMFRAGDILVESAGESGVQRLFDIGNPLKVQERLQEQIENVATRRSEDIQSSYAPTDIPPQQETIATQIKDLNDLRRQGIITIAEFENKKTELLKRL